MSTLRIYYQDLNKRESIIFQPGWQLGNAAEPTNRRPLRSGAGPDDASASGTLGERSTYQLNNQFTLANN
jgi:hypothetical protein